MARMYSKAKGKSGSKKPLKRIPSWAPYKETEVEKLVVKFAKAGKSSSEIGLILRDSYGINDVKALTNKKISAILKENNTGRKLPEDILALIKRLVSINQHLEKNKKDETAKRGLQLTSSKLRRIIAHHRSTGKLPKDWKLEMERLKMYLE